MSLKDNVQLVTLEDLTVISVHGFGKSPEMEAWQKLRAWVDSHHLTEQVEDLRFFGFNNPDPSAGSPNYGYEQWMTLPTGFKPAPEDTIKTLKGGLFATLSFENTTPELFGPTWKALGEWRMDSSYVYDDSRQWLEESLTPSASLDIEPGMLSFTCYMPVRKK